MKITERKESIDLLDGRENLSILHLSDIHLWYSTNILKFLEERIEHHKPDLIFMTGDYYDGPRGAFNLRTFLIRIAQKHLVLFIRGNHDILYGKKIADLILDIPNCFCVENSVFIYQSKTGFRYNITSWINRDRLPKGTDDINIILVHNPEKIREAELTDIHLILAGHLHGGQIVLFKTKTNDHFPGNLFFKYCTDRKQIGKTTLIVSRGVGDTLPVRLNCPKEVVQLTIK